MVFQGFFIVSPDVWQELLSNLTCAYVFQTFQGASKNQPYKVGPFDCYKWCPNPHKWRKTNGYLGLSTSPIEITLLIELKNLQKWKKTPVKSRVKQPQENPFRRPLYKDRVISPQLTTGSLGPSFFRTSFWNWNSSHRSPWNWKTGRILELKNGWILDVRARKCWDPMVG